MNHISLRLFAIFGFIVIAMMSRFVPHPPNFTAINAIALFSVYAIGHLGLSLFTVGAAMLLCDLVIGMHSQMLYVYFSLALITLTAHFSHLHLNRFRFRIPISLAASSLIFFLIVNFGVWKTDGLYPQTMQGLGTCYVAALPFLGNQLAGDLLYGAILFNAFSLLEKSLPTIRIKRSNTFLGAHINA